MALRNVVVRRLRAAVPVDAVGIRLKAAVLMLAAVTSGVSACGGGESAILHGDRLWADSQYTAALAEYRLALRQSGGASEAALLRAAHAFAETGEFDRAKEHYDDLLAFTPEYTEQAVYDYLLLARRDLKDGDRYGMARAVEAALALRPNLPLAELSEPLASYYAEVGADQDALVFYERALAHAPEDSLPTLLYTIGMLREDAEDCARAVDYFRAFRRLAPKGDRVSDAGWHLGNCAFQLARAAQGAGRLDDALDYLDTVIGLGMPANVQDEAWFRRGEILYAREEYAVALEAYRRVLDLNKMRVGRIVDQALERIDQIRFRPEPRYPRRPLDPLDRTRDDTIRNNF